MVKGTEGISNDDFGSGTGLVMYTNDDVSSDVGSITASSLSYNPARSKSVSNISIAFKFSKKMEVGNKFYIHLPGFTRNYEYVNKTHERHVNTGEERKRADILGGSKVGNVVDEDLIRSAWEDDGEDYENWSEGFEKICKFP